MPVVLLVVLFVAVFGALAAWWLYRRAQWRAAELAELRRSERRYRLLAEQAGDLVSMVDREGRWLYASPSHAGLLRGGSLLPGRDAFSAVHEEDQFRVRGALQVVMRSGESARLRMRVHSASGEVRHLETLAHAVRDGEGGRDESGEDAVTGAMLVSRDVTGLRDSEEQAEVAAYALERMSEAMMITSASGRILSVNRAYARVTGYAADEVLGKPESAYRTAMQPQSFHDGIYAEVLRSGHWDGSSLCQRSDGSVYREQRSVSAVRDAEGRITHYLSRFRDLGGLDEQGGQDAGPSLPRSALQKSA